MAQTDTFFVNFHFNVASDRGPRSIATFVTRSRAEGTKFNLEAVKETARQLIMSSRDREILQLLEKENIFEYLDRDTLNSCTIQRVSHGGVFIPDRQANRA